MTSFIAVFPQGVNDSWNMGPCCPPANLIGVADPAFLDALVADMIDRDDVDESRMYLTGFSNGALMVYAYACDHPEVFAAVAPMAGTNVTGCRPDRPVSLLHQHGDADLVVPYGGGVALGSLVSSAPFPSVEDSVAAWAAADGCSAEPTVVHGRGRGAHRVERLCRRHTGRVGEGPGQGPRVAHQGELRPA